MQCCEQTLQMYLLPSAQNNDLERVLYMKNKIIIFLCLLMLSAVPASASSWQPAEGNISPVTYVDVDSIRYSYNGNTIDKNYISYYSKQTTADGYVTLSYLRINVSAKTFEPLATIGMSRDQSSVSRSTSSGIAYRISQSKSVQASYDFVTKYCAAHDDIVTGNAGKQVSTDIPAAQQAMPGSPAEKAPINIPSETV